MQLVFTFLYGLHPWLPVAYILILTLGLLAPAIYCIRKKNAFSVVYVYRQAKNGDVGASVAFAFYALLIAFTIFIVLGLMF